MCAFPNSCKACALSSSCSECVILGIPDIPNTSNRATYRIQNSIEKSNSIELKTLGFSRVESLGRFPKSEISDALKMDWGKDVIEFDDLEEENGFKFKFIKVQGSEEDSDENEDN